MSGILTDIAAFALERPMRAQLAGSPHRKSLVDQRLGKDVRSAAQAAGGRGQGGGGAGEDVREALAYRGGLAWGNTKIFECRESVRSTKGPVGASS
jgi:hypothetical protein